MSALVAQGIEHRSPKAGVAGSNPAGGTVAINRNYQASGGHSPARQFTGQESGTHPPPNCTGWSDVVAGQRLVSGSGHRVVR